MSSLTEQELEEMCQHLSDIFMVEYTELLSGYNVGHEIEYHFSVKDRAAKPITPEELATFIAEYVLLDCETRGYSDLIYYQISLTDDSKNMMIFLKYLDKN